MGKGRYERHAAASLDEVAGGDIGEGVDRLQVLGNTVVGIVEDVSLEIADASAVQDDFLMQGLALPNAAAPIKKADLFIGVPRMVEPANVSTLQPDKSIG